MQRATRAKCEHILRVMRVARAFRIYIRSTTFEIIYSYESAICLTREEIFRTPPNSKMWTEGFSGERREHAVEFQTVQEYSCQRRAIYTLVAGAIGRHLFAGKIIGVFARAPTTGDYLSDVKH
jgi:hypothetical protein